MGLYEQDVARQTIDVDNISCSTLGERTLELDGNGAIYRMVVNVSRALKGPPGRWSNVRPTRQALARLPQPPSLGG